MTSVSDIEGAEIIILQHGQPALNMCEKTFIELHDTEYNGKSYVIQNMTKLIINHNFKIADQQGSAFVFQKNEVVS
jgi:hypothetical protein